MKTREYTREYLDYVLSIIGEDGKMQERRYFSYAEEPSERGKELCLMKAEDFANHRQIWINNVKQGEFAEYGISTDNIVEWFFIFQQYLTDKRKNKSWIIVNQY